MIKCQKVKYKDGVSYCIYHPLEKDEESGICFDFPEQDIGQLISLLQEYKTKEPEIYEEDEEYETRLKVIEEKHNKWYYKLWEKYLENISISINFFDWNLKFILIGRKKVFGNETVYAICRGIALGPIIITWK